MFGGGTESPRRVQLKAKAVFSRVIKRATVWRQGEAVRSGAERGLFVGAHSVIHPQVPFKHTRTHKCKNATQSKTTQKFNVETKTSSSPPPSFSWGRGTWFLRLPQFTPSGSSNDCPVLPCVGVNPMPLRPPALAATRCSQGLQSCTELGFGVTAAWGLWQHAPQVLGKVSWSTGENHHATGLWACPPLFPRVTEW